MIDMGEYIRAIRKDLGLTQAAFAEKIGKTRNDIAKYETGRAMPPGDVVLRAQRLAKKITNEDLDMILN